MNLKIILLILIVVLVLMKTRRKNKRIQINNINTNKQKMIIIGNGPSVMKKHLGSVIDKFDIVVRFNSFETNGFEKYVGSKTDFWFINAKNIRTKSEPIIEKLKYIKCKQIFIEQNPYDTKSKLLSYFPEIQKHNIQFMNMDDFHFIHNKFFKKGKLNPHASLGVRAIYTLSKRYYKTHDIYIYGFDNFNTQNIHYMNDNIKQPEGYLHNSINEQKIINFLENEYYLKYQ
tara:strand:- start:1099 stop:1788 length:690 start_codon:yes stop_codon:yes gene_type:complete